MSMSSSSTPWESEDAGPSTPEPPRRPPHPRRQQRCATLDVVRPSHTELERITSGVEVASPALAPTDEEPSQPLSPVAFETSDEPASAQPAPTSQPLSAVPPYMKPGRRRAHTVSVTLPWRKGYAPVPDDIEANPQPIPAARQRAPSTPRVRANSSQSPTRVRAGSSPQSPSRMRASSTSRRRSSSTGRASTDRSVSFSLPDNEHDIADDRGELHDDVVGLLDCVDPEVGTVNHLQNVTNAIMFPPIRGLSRRPNVQLSPADDEEATVPALPSQSVAKQRLGRRRADSAPPVPPPVDDKTEDEEEKAQIEAEDELVQHVGEDMTHELDAHMRRVLRRKKRDKAKSALRGLWAYLKTPMGAVTAVYGFLVAFWGAAIVLFLLGWIPTSSKHAKDKWVEISSQVTNGLFTVTGVGLIPWRATDSYRMGRIWTLRSRAKRRRNRQGLPPLKDWDDSSSPGYEYLTEEEREELETQQDKFSESQTWYRGHASATHYAFPIAWALWNTILMDMNSVFQCMLCGCMWGMNYHKRPAWTTGSLIPLSFLCGIGAAVLIWRGGVRTKKTEEVGAKLSKALGVDYDVEELKGRKRAATVGTTRPSLEYGEGGGKRGGKIGMVNGSANGKATVRLRRATVDAAAPGDVHVSTLTPLKETLESEDEFDPREKDIEMEDLALPRLPEISAIKLPGIDPVDIDAPTDSKL